MASLVAAGTLILFLLFLTPLIARLPVVALAALLIYGGFTLVEFDVMVRIYRFYPRSALLAALTTWGCWRSAWCPASWSAWPFRCWP